MIKELTGLIAELSRFQGRIVWNLPGRMASPADAWARDAREFGFKARTEFREGLQRTIKWYRSHFLRVTAFGV